MWYSTGLFALPVRWVLIRNPKGGFKPQALLCSDLQADPKEILSWFVIRWQLEEYHKSLKSNASLEKSPTKTTRTQSNHCFASIYAFAKLERLKLATKMNHFAIRSVIYLEALRASYQELKRMQLPDVGLGACA